VLDPAAAAQTADLERLMGLSDLDLVEEASSRFAGMSQIAALRATAGKRVAKKIRVMKGDHVKRVHVAIPGNDMPGGSAARAWRPRLHNHSRGESGI
jgi:hypothetical protein